MATQPSREQLADWASQVETAASWLSGRRATKLRELAEEIRTVSAVQPDPPPPAGASSWEV